MCVGGGGGVEGGAGRGLTAGLSLLWHRGCGETGALSGIDSTVVW